MNSKCNHPAVRHSIAYQMLSGCLSASLLSTTIFGVPTESVAKVIEQAPQETNLPAVDSTPSTKPESDQDYPSSRGEDPNQGQSPEQDPKQEQSPNHDQSPNSSRPEQDPDSTRNTDPTLHRVPNNSPDSPSSSQDERRTVSGSANHPSSPHPPTPYNGEHIQADSSATEGNPSPKSTADKPVATNQNEQDDAEAKRKRASDLYDRGNQAYALAQYAKAIELFEEAWKLSHEPTMLHNLGQAYWKRYNVEPQLDYLRQAKTLFSNYDKMMRANPEIAPSYNPSEIEGYITAISAQIHGVEQQQIADRRAEAAAKAAAAAAVKREGPTLRELQIQQRRRTTAAFKGTGIGLIVLGSTSFLAMTAGLITRGGTKFMLDHANEGGDRGVNLNSPKDEKSQRHWYQVGGKLAFAALISTAITLPIGIGLHVTAMLRQRKDRREERLRHKSKITYGPNPLEIHF